jgi:glycosyltransferase involved in cell wall biosynthesis
MNLSIVVPVYNEIDNIPLLHKEIHKTMDEQLQVEWELIFVDDGSTDGSGEAMEKLALADPDITRLISLRRNFGQTAAIAAGVDHALGETIVLMDADLQNDPADIPFLIEKINAGYDVVSGWRSNRQDPFITRILPSRIANSIISIVTGVHLHDYGCTLKAYRREVLTSFRLYGEMHRFIPAYANSVGAKMIEVPVRHHPRTHGETKYGLMRTFKVILDLFTVKFLISYAHKPIYLFGGAGVVLIAISTLTLLFLFIRRIWLSISVFDSPFFQMSTMFFILGFQSILMGLIAELLVRTYHESQHKPIYTIKKIFNPPESSPEDD